MRLERVTGSGSSLNGLFFFPRQGSLLEYTKCAHRAFYLQMLSLYPLSTSSKVLREFQLELCVQLPSPEPCHALLICSIWFCNICHRATCLSATAFGYLPWYSLRLSITKYQGTSYMRIIEVHR